VATAVAQLGVPTAFVTCVGRDALGDGLLELMGRRGVDVSGVQRADRPTRDVLVTRKEGGDRVFAGFGSPTGEYADCFLEAGSIPEPLVAGADVMVVGTLGLAQPVTRDGVTAAAAMARAAGTLLVTDVNWRPVFWDDPGAALPVIEPLLRQSEVVKLTDEEAEWLLGIPAAAALDDPARVEKALAASGVGGLRGVLVTAGERGASYSFGGATGFQPVFDIEVVDTTGAGDAFTAGFVTKLVEAGGVDALRADPARLRGAVLFAAACGAFTCTGPGAIDAQPTVADAEGLLRDQGLL